MDSSFRLVPSTQVKPAAATKETTNSLGLHDTLRYGPKLLATEVKGSSPLQKRLEYWEETQDNMKLTLQRNLYGIHAPIRRLMERKIVAGDAHMPSMVPRTNIHLDILMGRDETLLVTDFFGDIESVPPMDIHSDMEKKLHL